MNPLRPHNYYGGTTCPGRVMGQVRTIRGLIPEEEDDMLTAIQKEGSRAVYATDGIYKWGIPNPTMWAEMRASKIIAPGLVKVTANLFDRIRRRPVALTKADIEAACKAALPAGTSVDIPALARAVADEMARRMED